MQVTETWLFQKYIFLVPTHQKCLIFLSGHMNHAWQRSTITLTILTQPHWRNCIYTATCWINILPYYKPTPYTHWGVLYVQDRGDIRNVYIVQNLKAKGRQETNVLCVKNGGGITGGEVKVTQNITPQCYSTTYFVTEILNYPYPPLSWETEEKIIFNSSGDVRVVLSTLSITLDAQVRLCIRLGIKLGGKFLYIDRCQQSNLYKHVKFVVRASSIFISLTNLAVMDQL